MNIDTAIEILEDLMTSLPQFPPEMRREAVMLGIEALQAIRKWRAESGEYHQLPLPSETEEKKGNEGTPGSP